MFKWPESSLPSLLAVALAGLSVGVATFNHVGPVAILPSTTAAVLVILGFIPATWIARYGSLGPGRHLLATGLHLGILLPAIVFLDHWQADQRKCFVLALLACYFVALSLESLRWIQIVSSGD